MRPSTSHATNGQCLNAFCIFQCRFDEESQRVVESTYQHVDGYPRDMKIWRGVGYEIDTAFRYKDGKCACHPSMASRCLSPVSHTFIPLVHFFRPTPGKTYFFKGKSFRQFVDSEMRVRQEEPESSAVRWMRCQRTPTHSSFDDNHRQPLLSSGRTLSTSTAWLWLCLALALRQLFGA